jgi:hypothetical protein
VPAPPSAHEDTLKAATLSLELQWRKVSQNDYQANVYAMQQSRMQPGQRSRVRDPSMGVVAPLIDEDTSGKGKDAH